MLTGYTAGILDGKITTFPQFAKLCMRSFGATIHMHDESLDKEYYPREVSTYHKEKIERIEKEIELLEKVSDKQLIKDGKKRLKEEKENILKQIKIEEKQREKLEKMLNKAKSFIPPTEAHRSFKDFMINQLKQTIDLDCDTKYLKKKLNKIELQEKSIHPIILRKDKIKNLNEDLQYYIQEYKKEWLRVEESNKWVTDLLTALKNY